MARDWGVGIVNGVSGFLHRRAVRNAERALREMRGETPYDALTRPVLRELREPRRSAAR